MDYNVVASFFSTYVRPILDVLLLAFLIYNTYQILVKTQAIQLVKGILLLAGIYAVAFFLQLSTVTWILGIVAPGLVIGLAIIFQPELRRGLARIGQSPLFKLFLKEVKTSTALVVFGSFAGFMVDKDSDVDLLVVAGVKEKFPFHLLPHSVHEVFLSFLQGIIFLIHLILP